MRNFLVKSCYFEISLELKWPPDFSKGPLFGVVIVLKSITKMSKTENDLVKKTTA